MLLDSFKFNIASSLSLLILLVCILVSWIIIIERCLYFSKKNKAPRQALDEFLASLPFAKQSNASVIEEHRKNPITYVLNSCLRSQLHNQKIRLNTSLYEEAKNCAIAEKLPEMEHYLSIQATLATISPYIGLLGTILGIIRAFSSLGGIPDGNEANGIGTTGGQLNAGIAEALIATAGGLLVAIPATISYNYFRRRLENMVRDIEIAAAYLKIYLSQKQVK